jgi:hypothetical protein
VGEFEVANVVLIELDGHAERHATSSVATLRSVCLILKNRLNTAVVEPVSLDS